jgi:hypothetical protein
VQDCQKQCDSFLAIQTKNNVEKNMFSWECSTNPQNAKTTRFSRTPGNSRKILRHSCFPGNPGKNRIKIPAYSQEKTRGSRKEPSCLILARVQRENPLTYNKNRQMRIVGFQKNTQNSGNILHTLLGIDLVIALAF